MSGFCSEHKCIKEKVESTRADRKFWHKILDSKWFYGMVTGVIALCLAFGGWTVREIYAQKANEEKNKTASEVICKKVEEIKQEMKEIKTEMKDENKRRDEQRDKDQSKLMDILLDIKKQTKK